MAMTDGTTTWSYTYNADGLRTSKTNGSLNYTYFYDSGRLYYMTRGTDQLWFAYDDSVPMFVKYNATTYLYLTNLQGDVIAILDNTGAKVVEYSYDAWGNLLSITGSMASTLGVINPLTYRGYVYDHETELYYLQSRYYNPEWRRFINADSFVSTGGTLGSNMFAYCGNNPVAFGDPSGHARVGSLNRDICSTLYDYGLGGGAGGGGALALYGGLALGEQFVRAIEKLWSGFVGLFFAKSDSIDWRVNDNLKHHIVVGTKGRHIGGWKPFGTDPNKNDSDNWLVILPVIQEVVDDADYYYQEVLKDGATVTYYVKTYIEEGVKVVVKIWESVDGLIQQISDAIPYLLN